MLSVCPSLAPAEVGAIIRDTCSLLPEARTCVGKGLLDCAEAVERAVSIAPTS
ncbi:MAG TPA: hypothetical protein VF478_03735 [Anaerolineae bacterium]